jgi:hypothetical protein
MSVDHVRADGCLDIQTINHHMEIKAASLLSSHVKIHKPVTTASGHSTTHRLSTKKKRQSVKKETCKGSRPPFAKESSAHLAPRTPHTDKRREELRPFFRCAGRFPFCLTGGPAAAAGLHSALQLACIFLHVASHSYVSTWILVCRAER